MSVSPADFRCFSEQCSFGGHRPHRGDAIHSEALTRKWSSPLFFFGLWSSNRPRHTLPYFFQRVYYSLQHPGRMFSPVPRKLNKTMTPLLDRLFPSRGEHKNGSRLSMGKCHLHIAPPCGGILHRVLRHGGAVGLTNSVIVAAHVFGQIFLGCEPM